MIIYIMGNDKVALWLAIFLASFRDHNPEAVVKLIPYAADLSVTAKLCKHFDVELLDFDFSQIDEYAKKIFPGNKKWPRLRKLLALDCCADRFLYTDIDTVVTSSFASLQNDSNTAFDIVYGTRSGDSVYKQAGLELFSGRTHTFSSGFLYFDNSKRRFSTQAVLDTIHENFVEYNSIRADNVIDQPILNYFVDKTGLVAGSVADANPALSPHNWYNDPTLNWSSGKLKDKYDRDVLLVHWAGEDKLSGKLGKMSDLFSRYQANAEKLLALMGT